MDWFAARDRAAVGDGADARSGSSCGSGRAEARRRPQPIAFTPLERKEPVSFAKEILPVLSKNCLSCHNAAKAENSLVLETPQAMLKGGDDGPAIVPGKSAESLLLKVAAHQVEPTMPPDDNNVDAKPLTPGRTRNAGGLDRSGSHRRCRHQGGAGEMADAGQHGAADLRRRGLARGTICGLHARKSDFRLSNWPSGQLATNWSIRN